MQENVFIGETHRTFELWDLQHPELMPVVGWANISKAIDSSDRTQRSVDSLPSTCSVRTVIHNQERLVIDRFFLLPDERALVWAWLDLSDVEACSGNPFLESILSI